MKTKKKSHKILVIVLIIIVFISNLNKDLDLRVFAVNKVMLVKGTNVNVRSGPSTTTSVLGKVTAGYKINILGAELDEQGKTWYKFNYGNKIGYIRSDFLKGVEVKYVTDANFERELDGEGFPNDYKELLRLVHAEHPNWKFKLQKINMDFNYAVENELFGTKSLIHSSAISSHKSTDKGKYDYTTSTWPTFDSGMWVAASREIIAYYMDPRNFLADPFIFQFEVQTFDKTLHNLEGVKKMVKGTFLDGFIDTTLINQSPSEDLVIPIIIPDTTNIESPNGQEITPYKVNGEPSNIDKNMPYDGNYPTENRNDRNYGPGVIDYSKPIVPMIKEGIAFSLSNIIVSPNAANLGITSNESIEDLSFRFNYLQPGRWTYSDVIYDACSQIGINPYVVVSMILQEQGTEGKSDSISGKNAKFPGVYNYGNVGAYAANGYTAVENGLRYAKTEGRYNRPWDTKEKALYGVVDYYASSFIKKGQDTFYLKKWDVIGDFKNQYMTNVAGAVSEGQLLATGYDEEMTNATHIFKIPYYNNMPNEVSPMPTKTGSPNNKLKTLTVASYGISPTFDPDVNNYSLILESNVSYITVNAEPYDKKAGIIGAGNIPITVTNTLVQISVIAENGDINTYNIDVYKKGVENVPVPSDLVIPIIVNDVNNNININTDFKLPVVTEISVGPGERR